MEEYRGLQAEVRIVEAVRQIRLPGKKVSIKEDASFDALIRVQRIATHSV